MVCEGCPKKVLQMLQMLRFHGAFTGDCKHLRKTMSSKKIPIKCKRKLKDDLFDGKSDVQSCTICNYFVP